MFENDIFLYHLDFEIQKLFGLDRYNKKNVYNAFLMVTKVAFLICNNSLIIPFSNYLESDLAYKIVNFFSLQDMPDMDTIKYASNAYNISEFVDKKKTEHEEMFNQKGYHYVELDTPKKEIILPSGKMVKRAHSTTQDIRRAWTSDIGINYLSELVYNMPQTINDVEKIETELYLVPERLENKAFISNYITPLLSNVSGVPNLLDTEMNRYITSEYIKSYLDEYNAICLCDIPIIDANQILPKGEKYTHISYKEITRIFASILFEGKSLLDYVYKSDYKTLRELKQSEFKRLMEEKIDKESNYKKGIIDMNDNPTIGIITALPVELAAVRRIIGNLRQYYDNSRDKGRLYELGEIQNLQGKKHKVVVALSGEGNDSSAIVCTDMLNIFPSVKEIIMCGIAAGIPKCGIRLGDIAISNSVIQYDYGKIEDEGYVLKSIPLKSSAKFEHTLKIIETDEYSEKYLWHSIIDEFAIDKFERPDNSTDPLREEADKLERYPRTINGCIASANLVVKKGELRDEIEKKHKAIAIEMEGSGIADAARYTNVGFIVIRGVCDYADSLKDDTWHNYAAVVAASYTVTLIKYLPVT